MRVCTAVRALVQQHARNMVARSRATGPASLSGRLVTLSVPSRPPSQPRTRLCRPGSPVPLAPLNMSCQLRDRLRVGWKGGRLRVIIIGRVGRRYMTNIATPCAKTKARKSDHAWTNAETKGERGEEDERQAGRDRNVERARKRKSAHTNEHCWPPGRQSCTRQPRIDER